MTEVLPAKPFRLADRKGEMMEDNEPEAADRILAQRMTALNHANEIRAARAQLRRKVEAGEVSLIDVLNCRPPEADGWYVFDALCAQSRWGSTRSRKLLGRLMIPELRPLRQLTDRQRNVLANALTKTVSFRTDSKDLIPTSEET